MCYMTNVSVIIPVYGVESYIERCARSLFGQTLDDIEYLFIDDCTPDKSIEILMEVLEEYPNRKGQVIIHRMGQNSGQAKVREWGMRNATGKYLIHCDTDDWIEPSMYKEMYECAESTNSDMVVSDYLIEKDGEHTLQKGLVISSNKMLAGFILRKNKCCLWNKLIKRELFESQSFRYPNGNMGEDMATILQVLPFCGKIEYIEKPFYHYFINGGSLTQTTSPDKVYARFCQLKENVDLIVEVYKLGGLYDKYSDEFISLKLHVKFAFLPLLKDKAMRKQWVNIYPEINWPLILSRYVDPKNKLRFYLTRVKYIINK